MGQPLPDRLPAACKGVVANTIAIIAVFLFYIPVAFIASLVAGQYLGNVLVLLKTPEKEYVKFLLLYHKERESREVIHCSCRCHQSFSCVLLKLDVAGGVLWPKLWVSEALCLQCSLRQVELLSL